MKIKDLTGKKFSKLVALSYVEKNKWGHALWLYQCDCGNQKSISSNSVTQGNTKSCGCLDHENHIHKPNRVTHGHCGERIYRIWKAMKNRCNNPNTLDYQKWYGSKGVQVCDDWNNNFWMFYNWAICHGYNDRLSIDRTNPFGNYEPSNCRWATSQQQANNKRKGVQ